MGIPAHMVLWQIVVTGGNGAVGSMVKGYAEHKTGNKRAGNMNTRQENMYIEQRKQ
jgi:hypothetical protein